MQHHHYYHSWSNTELVYCPDSNLHSGRCHYLQHRGDLSQRLTFCCPSVISVRWWQHYAVSLCQAHHSYTTTTILLVHMSLITTTSAAFASCGTNPCCMTHAPCTLTVHTTSTLTINNIIFSPCDWCNNRHMCQMNPWYSMNDSSIVTSHDFFTGAHDKIRPSNPTESTNTILILGPQALLETLMYILSLIRCHYLPCASPSIQMHSLCSTLEKPLYISFILA